jgi:hypothetical protein
MNIIVCEYNDGFDIVIENSDDTRKRFSFNQEDSKERMVEVFEYLGIESEYEECY